MTSGGQCRRRCRLAEVSLVRGSPAERLMRTAQIIPVEELGQAALLFDAGGGRAQIDPFVLHGPPQALDEDVVVATPASVHADLDPMIPQQLGGASLVICARPLSRGQALIGIEDARLAEPGEGLLNASTQTPAVSVFDSRQDSTRRV